MRSAVVEQPVAQKRRAFLAPLPFVFDAIGGLARVGQARRTSAALPRAELQALDSCVVGARLLRVASRAEACSRVPRG
jgi:hypothetical protein